MFNSKVTDIIIKNSCIDGVVLKNGSTINSQKVIGFNWALRNEEIYLNYYIIKRLKLNLNHLVRVRVEHSQELIDQIQYKCKKRSEYLPKLNYSLVKQINGRGVYSFCMCPGGIIDPLKTSPGEVVTNGWSPSRRDYPTSNSGIVVELKEIDFKKYR